MPNSRSNDGELAARVIAVESLLTHLQRTVQELDQVVTEQGRAIDELAKRVRRLASELSALQDATVEEPEEEEGPAL